MLLRPLATTALLSLTAAIALPSTQAAAGSIELGTAAIAADLDNRSGTAPLSSLIGTDSPFVAVDVIGDGEPAADLVFGTSTRFSQASIDARTVFAQTLDVSGTSRTSGAGDTFHIIELDVTLEDGELFVADGHNAGTDNNAFDRVLLNSVQLFDTTGAVVPVTVSVIDNGLGAPSLALAPGAGTYRAVFTASAPSPVGDDEFDVRFSTVTAVPSPTAAAAGLLGLVGLVARRRRTA